MGEVVWTEAEQEPGPWGRQVVGVTFWLRRWGARREWVQ